MARPIKEGLDYFPLDVDIDQDDKMSVVEALHGLEGFGVAIKLLMKIYKESYFYKWTKREQLIFSNKVNVDINRINQIVTDCIEEGLFDKKTFEKYSVLTSKGIQKRYLEAVTRRKEVTFRKEFLLIDPYSFLKNGSKLEVFIVKEDENGELIRVNVNINDNSPDVNDNKSTQRKGKQSITEDKKTEKTQTNKNSGVVVASQNIYTFYESNFGTINPFMSETLGYWADDVGEELLLEAMKIALAQQKKFKYAEGVLKSWKNDGVKTVADIEKAKPKKKNDIDWDNL